MNRVFLLTIIALGSQANAYKKVCFTTHGTTPPTSEEYPSYWHLSFNENGYQNKYNEGRCFIVFDAEEQKALLDLLQNADPNAQAPRLMYKRMPGPDSALESAQKGVEEATGYKITADKLIEKIKNPENWQTIQIKIAEKKR